MENSTFVVRLLNSRHSVLTIRTIKQWRKSGITFARCILSWTINPSVQTTTTAWRNWQGRDFVTKYFNILKKAIVGSRFVLWLWMKIFRWLQSPQEDTVKRLNLQNRCWSECRIWWNRRWIIGNGLHPSFGKGFTGVWREESFHIVRPGEKVAANNCTSVPVETMQAEVLVIENNWGQASDIMWYLLTKNPAIYLRHAGNSW